MFLRLWPSSPIRTELALHPPCSESNVTGPQHPQTLHGILSPIPIPNPHRDLIKLTPCTHQNVTFFLTFSTFLRCYSESESAGAWLLVYGSTLVRPELLVFALRFVVISTHTGVHHSIRYVRMFLHLRCPCIVLTPVGQRASIAHSRLFLTYNYKHQRCKSSTF